VNAGQRISLLDWKAQNIRNSWFLGAFMVLLLAGIAYLLALAFDPASATLFVAIAILTAGVQNVVAYWFSDRLALAATGAREATREEHRYLVNVTEAVAIGAGVPVPKIWVIDSPAPNAFATGRNPQHAAVAVTTGLLQLLDRQELEGVIAHELAHVRNYDMLFGSMLMATVGAIVLLRDLILRGMRYGGGGRRRSDGGGRGGGQAQALGYLLLIVLLVLAPLLATLLHLAVSRKREYLADATGAWITRNPEGLARALEKLRDYSAAPLRVSEGVRHMFFVNPVKQLNASRLGSTHPPIEERIRRLRQM
jgi:heat shock protein HtpX